MHARFMEGAVFSFNYNTLILVASVMAALGLASNGSATIIASMLVSPIMGPVAAMAYGTSIWDRQMIKIAVKNELVSLAFCVFVGIVMGLITGATSLSNDWLTPEMKTRATLSNLLVGIPTAFFSGLGVAVSLLDDQVNSLVGVAISASLLPPAVNCGMIWASYGLYRAGVLGTSQTDLTKADFWDAGWMSLSLTLVNIVLVWLASVIMFRLKEVSYHLSADIYILMCVLIRINYVLTFYVFSSNLSCPGPSDQKSNILE